MITTDDTLLVLEIVAVNSDAPAFIQFRALCRTLRDAVDSYRVPAGENSLLFKWNSPRGVIARGREIVFDRIMEGRDPEYCGRCTVEMNHHSDAQFVVIRERVATTCMLLRDNYITAISYRQCYEWESIPIEFLRFHTEIRYGVDEIIHDVIHNNFVDKFYESVQFVESKHPPVLPVPVDTTFEQYRELVHAETVRESALLFGVSYR